MWVFNKISEWFWNEDIWLPPGYNWNSFRTVQVTNSSNVRVEPSQFAQFGDLLYPIPLSLILILLRFLVTKHVFRPMATMLGLRSRLKQCPPSENSQLEAVYRSSRSTLSQQDLKNLSEQCGISVIQVSSIIELIIYILTFQLKIERWMRQRRMWDVPDTTAKFCETGWRYIPSRINLE